MGTLPGRQKTPNARQGITTICGSEARRALGIPSENPQCPTGHYDPAQGHGCCSPYVSQKTPNARQGITTQYVRHEAEERRYPSENPQCPTGHYDRMATTARRRSKGIKSENPQCPTGHYDAKERGTRICWPRVRKPPMPDRALRRIIFVGSA